MSIKQSIPAVCDTAETPEVTVEGAIEQAKRAYSLQIFEQAVEHYATALELMTKKYGDASPECVDLYFAYGKALLENAIAQSSVLGKEETTAALDADEVVDKASGSGPSASGTRIHFGEDTTEEGDTENLDARETDQDEQTIDLFAEAVREPADDQGEHRDAESDGDGEGEPEDDFNAAWEVLEVARSLYEAQKDSDEKIRLKLADTYIALGDVSLETEKLEQAVSDYTTAVALKTDILPRSSRQIAEVHYKLCIVYDMTAGRLAHAIEHAKRAEASVQARLDEITTHLKTSSIKDRVQLEIKVDTKGKGKATSSMTGAELSLEEMTKAQLESEVQELKGLLEDVSLKIEELKSSPDIAEASAPDLVAQELDRDLNGTVASSAAPTQQINDLTSMVVKKKKKIPESTGGKRKADDEETAGSPEKRMRVDGTL
ncbi:hypothetical protein K439DRAFT_1387288 [Ramaria rubella]|nr:hypothetical protein K439DRAFT_1387288 [Ramaria rubella]